MHPQDDNGGLKEKNTNLDSSNKISMTAVNLWKTYSTE